LDNVNHFQQNSSARFVGPAAFSGSANAPLCHRLYQKRQQQPRCGFVDGFDCERRGARRVSPACTALVYLCAHQELRDAGTVEDLELAKPAKGRSVEPCLRRIFADVGCRLPVRASLCRKASGSITVQPTASCPSRRCVLERTFAWTSSLSLVPPRTLVRLLSLDLRIGSRIAIAPQRPR
jgi:hypothetical protein